jgi:glycolate oxidase iron-sulfur subunit
MVGVALKLYQKTGLRTVARRTGLLKRLPRYLGHADKYLPDLSNNFFAPKGQVFPAKGAKRAKVAMLAGCVMALTHAETLEATVRVLARNGIEVHLTAGQGCCGALNSDAGEFNSSIDMAKRNIDSFLSINPDAIVSASAGCGANMKQYAELIGKDDEYADKADRVAELTRDIHELLIEYAFEPPKKSLDVTVTYQDPCHLVNVQKITSAPRKILNSIPGLKLVELSEPEVCCGSAGTYAITQLDMSVQLGRRKARNIVKTGAEIVATANPGCALQLDFALQQIDRQDSSKKTTVRYVVDLLDAAYALE